MSKLLKKSKILLVILLMIAMTYGFGRLYFKVTDGFSVENITENFPVNEKWNVKPLNAQDQAAVDKILDEPFTYLGKGCQSYVFLSQDGEYVLKFFKYQRFRTKPWVNWFSFIPYVHQHRAERIELKRKKLDVVFNSWKLAFEELKPETGIVFVHLNKSDTLNKNTTLYDKIGFKHVINADEYQFLIQKKAKMLTTAIQDGMKNGQIDQTKALLSRLLGTILAEYNRGYADNDHALMQNTGVLDGSPIHIDVGQFVKNPHVVDPLVYKQELFTKTFKFRKWLKENYPKLAVYFDEQLKEIIGERFDSMIPVWREHFLSCKD